MEEKTKELQNKIVTGQIDINSQELFVSSLFKSLLHDLNSRVKVRGDDIPHYMLNTGDDIMYLEHKGYDYSKEPAQNTNESYIYSRIPRCLVDLTDIEVLEDQVTNPYIRGNFEITYDDELYGMSAEFRRMPLKVSVELKYYLDSFTDVLGTIQNIISKLLFIKTFKFDYMGETMQGSYKMPTTLSHEKNITFDGGTTDQKLRTISLSIEVETNMPIYDERTAIALDNVITSSVYEPKFGNGGMSNEENKE
jgi:hypothetical protein